MSREQWGHGYRRGVYDAQIGCVKCADILNLDTISKFMILHMMASNYNKNHNRCQYPVSEFYARGSFLGIEKDMLDNIKKYIEQKHPYNVTMMWHVELGEEFLLPNILPMQEISNRIHELIDGEMS